MRGKLILSSGIKDRCKAKESGKKKRRSLSGCAKKISRWKASIGGVKERSLLLIQ